MFYKQDRVGSEFKKIIIIVNINSIKNSTKIQTYLHKLSLVFIDK